MIRNDPYQPEFVDFYLPFGGRLKATNRWVKLSEMIPWKLVEECYRQSLSETEMGAPALSGRIAYGALVIKERLGVTDEESVEQITENPYLQYFLGYREMLKSEPFDASMMVHFRARFSQDHHQKINAEIIAEATASEPVTEQSEVKECEEQQLEGVEENEPNAGKLLVDASCTPADIRYPTDLSLLNEAREKAEDLIDRFHDSIRANAPSKVLKPRTYRQKARKQYLLVAKKKQPGSKAVRKAIGQQLRYLRRNLGHMARMTQAHPELLASLARRDRYAYKCLLVIATLYQQQLEMYQSDTRSVSDRIVSIAQPHVRPMVRGKSGRRVEFGAKISMSHQKEGYVSLDRLSWDPYHESGDLPEQIETYRRRFGYYPASVHADAIYRTRENRRYCTQRGIRLSGKPLGRPPKLTTANAAELKALKRQQRADEIDRIPIEGKFGNVKRKGTLDRVMAKLANTSQSVIMVAIVVLNLDKRLRALLLRLWVLFQPAHPRALALRVAPIWFSTRLACSP